MSDERYQQRQQRVKENLQRKDDVFVKAMHKVRVITPKMTFSLILIVLPY